MTFVSEAIGRRTVLAWATRTRPESASMATNELALIDPLGTADAVAASSDATLRSATRPRQRHAARRTLPTRSTPHSSTPADDGAALPRGRRLDACQCGRRIRLAGIAASLALLAS